MFPLNQTKNPHIFFSKNSVCANKKVTHFFSKNNYICASEWRKLKDQRKNNNATRHGCCPCASAHGHFHQPMCAKANTQFSPVAHVHFHQPRCTKASTLSFLSILEKKLFRGSRKKTPISHHKVSLLYFYFPWNPLYQKHLKCNYTAWGPIDSMTNAIGSNTKSYKTNNALWVKEKILVVS